MGLGAKMPPKFKILVLVYAIKSAHKQECCFPQMQMCDIHLPHTHTCNLMHCSIIADNGYWLLIYWLCYNFAYCKFVHWAIVFVKWAIDKGSDLLPLISCISLIIQVLFLFF